MSVKENLIEIQNRIKIAAEQCGRNPEEVKLLAVSKFHPLESIEEAINAGQKQFGENRVQEANEKFTVLNQKYPDIQLHIIGQLQLNKVKTAISIASCIESVDRIELLNEIEKQCNKINKKIKVLFEVHTGEESKSGFKSLDDLNFAIKACAEGNYPHIITEGFMTMAPFTEDKELIRKSFRNLRNIRDDMQIKFPQFDLHELSMGMSGDFEIAIEEGSTLVRVGTAIFGERDYSKK